MATAPTEVETPVTDSESVSHSVMSDSLRPHGLYVAHQAPLSMDSPGKNTRVGPFLSEGNDKKS